MEHKTLTVTSPAFVNEGLIPIRHTGRGEDLSPEINLSTFDARAVSLAVVLNDLAHPIRGFNHWVLWNLPATQTIPENIPHGEHVAALGGAAQGRGYGKHRYRGPKPPFRCSHRYEFRVYVLDCTLDLPVTSRKRHLLAAMQGHIVQEGVLVGHFR